MNQIIEDDSEVEKTNMGNFFLKLSVFFVVNQLHTDAVFCILVVCKEADVNVLVGMMHGIGVFDFF